MGRLTHHPSENQLFFLSILCSASSFDFTDSTFACARNLKDQQQKSSKKIQSEKAHTYNHETKERGICDQMCLE
ncbi:hypothetical protein HanRHA438_Chr10g0480361 [Helianthus annuus]|nr:hypothetical protein HanRHA438_Chr10g0480361 [Helianthus annuus]